MENLSYQSCRYSNRSCENRPLIGYQYCRLHILEDKGSNFAQCSYLSAKTGRRCNKSAQKMGFDSLCSLHARGGTQRTGFDESRIENVATVETLLSELSQFSRPELVSVEDHAVPGQDELPRNNSRVGELDNEVVESREAQTSAYILESDSESLDSENEDPFKYAEILTQEEVTRLTRDKLIRLQSLYIEQFKWLQHSLRDSRARYLRDVKVFAAEDKLESGAGPSGVGKANTRLKTVISTSTDGERMYRAARRYHRKHGREALLYDKCHDRRRRVAAAGILGATPTIDASRHHSRSVSRCANKTSKCQEVPLPMSKYCIKHIDCDTYQVLYKPCNFSSSSERFACRRPVVNLYEESRCSRHTNMSDLAGFAATPAMSRAQSFTGPTEQSLAHNMDTVILSETSPALPEDRHPKELDQLKKWEGISVKELEASPKELDTHTTHISHTMEIDSNVIKELENNIINELESSIIKELEDNPTKELEGDPGADRETHVTDDSETIPVNEIYSSLPKTIADINEMDSPTYEERADISNSREIPDSQTF